MFLQFRNYPLRIRFDKRKTIFRFFAGCHILLCRWGAVRWPVASKVPVPRFVYLLLSWRSISSWSLPGEPRRQISFSACTNFNFRPCLTVTGKACQFPFTWDELKHLYSHFFNSILKCAATTGTSSSGAQPRWSTGWSPRIRRRTMKRARATARGSDFPGKGKEDQDRLYGAGRWVLKDLHGLSSWYFWRWFALGGARRRQRQEDRSLKLPGAPQKETGEEGINNQYISSWRFVTLYNLYLQPWECPTEGIMRIWLLWSSSLKTHCWSWRQAQRIQPDVKSEVCVFYCKSCVNWAGHNIIQAHSLTLWAFFRKVYLLYVVRVKAAPQSKKFFCHYTGRLQLKYSFHVSQRWHPLINFVLGVGFSHGWLDGLAMLNPVWGPAWPFPVFPKWL